MMKFSALQAVLLCLSSGLSSAEGGFDLDVDAIANMTDRERGAHLAEIFGTPRTREEALTGRKQEEKDCEDEECDVDEKVARKLEAEELTERNRGVIIEVFNCAVFLWQVIDMLGMEGPVSFDMEIRKDVVSAKPVNESDEEITANISDVMLGEPIGEEGEPITLGGIIEGLRSIHRRLGRFKAGSDFSIYYIPGEDKYLEYSIDLLEDIQHFLGREGPIWFQHGIVENSNQDAGLDALRRASKAPVPVPDEDSVGYAKVELEGELLRVPVGRKGKEVTIDDFVSAFFAASTNPTLEAYRKSGRSYYHEGFGRDDKDMPTTLFMYFGS